MGNSVESGYGARFDYRVDILRRRNLLTAHSRSGVLIAQSKRTLLIDEQNHGLVFYFPRADIRMELLAACPERTSSCPYKGTASYWNLIDDPEEPIGWSYDTPFAEVGQISGHIAFYQNRATVTIGVAETMHL